MYSCHDCQKDDNLTQGETDDPFLFHFGGDCAIVTGGSQPCAATRQQLEKGY